jgi:hypothetical protein
MNITETRNATIGVKNVTHTTLQVNKMSRKIQVEEQDVIKKLFLYLQALSDSDVYSIFMELYTAVCILPPDAKPTVERGSVKMVGASVLLMYNGHVLISVGHNGNRYYFFTFHPDTDVATPIEVHELISLIRKRKIMKI